MRGRTIGRLAQGFFGCAALAFAASIATGAVPEAERRASAIFFEGRHAVASLRGDERALPSDAARCANCHDGAGHRVPRGRGAGEAGPPLTREQLVGMRSRRGGPASRFDEHAFCRLLATGIDPADIVVRRGMPLYRLSAPDCAALWALLAEGSPR